MVQANGWRPGLARIAGALLLPCVFATCGGGLHGPPSVILVTLDTTRADRLGIYGGTSVPTPHLDSIGAEGAVFETAMSQVPLTLPAHSSILTGRYPATHGVRHNGIYRLPPDELSLAEVLADQGYDTAAFVASYVLNRGYGTEQGFAHYDDIDVNRFEGGQDRLFEAERSADEVNEAVFRWLDRRPDAPVFLWVHYYDPHDPYEPPEKGGRTLAGEGYDREISYLDHCFGELRDRLDASGLLDRSVLVVVGDHGESLGEHDEKTHGIFVYDATMRVPLFVRAPGLVAPGTRVTGPAELVDLAPTILDLAGLPPMPAAQGRSLVPALSGEESGLEHVAFGESLMARLEFGWSELYTARDVRFRFVDAPVPELYDLKTDPGEVRNLAPEDPTRAAAMAERLAAWRAASETASSGAGSAKRVMSPEEEARLRSLGYLGGDAFREDGPDSATEAETSRPDPKAMMPEVRRLDEARELLRAGDPAGALAGVEAILEGNPRNQQARATRIGALIDLGRLADAEEEARAGLSLAATDPDLEAVLTEKNLGLLGGVLRLRGETGEAEAVFREIMDRFPRNETARVDLARMLAETGREDEAIVLADEALEANPRNGFALAARFVAEARSGREAAALETAQALAEQRAGDSDVLVRAGDLLLGAGRPALAARAYEGAQEQLELDPLLLGKLGSALLAAGDLEAARLPLRSAARLAPGDPRPRFYLGSLALQEGNEEEARLRFREALERGPAFTAPLVTLGGWLVDQGRIEEARSVLEDAIRRNPRDGRARALLESL